MTATYDIVTIEENGDFFWGVYENPSEQVVFRSVFEEEARDYRKFLNRGGAFSGFTPSFMLVSTANIDSAFEELVENELT